MDKIFSARVDEAILNKISFLAQRLHISKKKVIEGAISLYANSIDSAGEINVFDQTSGVWERPESAEQTVAHAKNAFKKSLRRYQK